MSDDLEFDMLRSEYNKAVVENSSLRKQLQEASKAMRALESLTPGGSEYVGDIPRCVDAIKHSRQFEHDMMVKFKKERDEAQQNAAMDCGHARRFYMVEGDYADRDACSECERIEALERSVAEWKAIAVGEREAHEGMRDYHKELERRAKDAEHLRDENWDSYIETFEAYKKAKAENAALLAQNAVMRDLLKRCEWVWSALHPWKICLVCDASLMDNIHKEGCAMAAALEPNLASEYVAVRREILVDVMNLLGAPTAPITEIVQEELTERLRKIFQILKEVNHALPDRSSVVVAQVNAGDASAQTHAARRSK